MMLTILECDLGNTRCKWRVLDGKEVLSSGQFVYQQGFDGLEIAAKVDRVRVVSVASPEVVECLAHRLRETGVELEFAVSSAAACGVVNGYDEPSKLGVDRWLAVVAAYKRQHRAVLVLDAGSALTVDLVDASGLHLGGYILPGAALMRSSLLSNADGVCFDPRQGPMGLGWGSNTQAAVDAGVLAAQLGAVLVAVDRTKRQLGKDFAILLTGGDAETIKAYLPSDIGDSIELVPELVLDGLGWVLP